MTSTMDRFAGDIVAPRRPGAAHDFPHDLWQGLADGTIDAVVSDHSPSTADLKQLDTGDFGTAWGGVASLQLGLPIVWTAAATRGHGLVDVARWMSSRPAEMIRSGQGGASGLDLRRTMPESVSGTKRLVRSSVGR